MRAKNKPELKTHSAKELEVILNVLERDGVEAVKVTMWPKLAALLSDPVKLPNITPLLVSPSGLPLYGRLLALIEIIKAQPESEITGKCRRLINTVHYLLCINEGIPGNEYIDAPITNAGDSVLHKVAREGDAKATKILLDKGANPNVRTRDGNTPLQDAAQGNHLPVLTLLLQHPLTELDPKDAKGQTPLMAAAAHGHAAVIKMLFKFKTPSRKIDIEAIAISGMKVLDFALVGGHTAAMEALLVAGANANAPRKDGSTFLHEVARKGDIKAARVLIKHKADINAEENGFSPLVMAVQEGHADFVKMLLQQPGINKNATNIREAHVLHIAVFRGHIDVLRILLLEPDINVDAYYEHSFPGDPNIYYPSPLLLAVWYRRKVAVELLLATNRVNIDVEIIANSKYTVLDLVRDKGPKEIYDLLVAYQQRNAALSAAAPSLAEAKAVAEPAASPAEAKLPVSADLQEHKAQPVKQNLPEEKARSAKPAAKEDWLRTFSAYMEKAMAELQQPLQSYQEAGVDKELKKARKALHKRYGSRDSLQGLAQLAIRQGQFKPKNVPDEKTITDCKKAGYYYVRGSADFQTPMFIQVSDELLDRDIRGKLENYLEKHDINFLAGNISGNGLKKIDDIYEISIQGEKIRCTGEKMEGTTTIPTPGGNIEASLIVFKPEGFKKDHKALQRGLGNKP